MNATQPIQEQQHYLCLANLLDLLVTVYTLDTEHVPLFISVYASFIELILAGIVKT